ncbi:MAG TPA: hypothetical protein VMU53_13595 [Candidatus Sulfotelmatobacter sp.]|nr:hypothetical protein [Candidatus Sulfotelmatobacter sp.]
MKKTIGISLIVVGIMVGLFIRLNIGIAVAFLGALFVSPELLAKLTQKRKP